MADDDLDRDILQNGFGKLRHGTRQDPPAKGSLKRKGQGLFAQALLERFPNLPYMLGYFKKQLAGASRAELLAHIEDYRRALVPLTLMRHYVRALDIEFLRDQVYLKPHPKELRLRNHV